MGAETRQPAPPATTYWQATKPDAASHLCVKPSRLCQQLAKEGLHGVLMGHLQDEMTGSRFEQRESASGGQSSQKQGDG